MNCTETRNTTGGCQDLSICVVDGTSYVDLVDQIFPNVSLKVLPTVQSFYRGMRVGVDNGGCNVLAGEQFDIAHSVVKSQGINIDYAVGKSLYSKEPLGLGMSYLHAYLLCLFLLFIQLLTTLLLC